MSSENWGNPKRQKKTTVRGLVGGSTPQTRAEILLVGIDDRWSYQIGFWGGRSARAFYVFESREDAQRDATTVALAVLAAIVPKEGKS